MKKRMTKIAAIVLSTIMALEMNVSHLTNVSAMEAKDETPVISECKTLPEGFFEDEVIYAGEIAEEDKYVKQDIYYSSVYADEWDKYSTNYYYNQLNETEKAFWDALDSMCLEYLLQNKDAGSTGLTKYVDAIGIEGERAISIARIFRLSNPQYYFLTTNIWYSSYYSYSTQSFTYSCAFKIYDDFVSGATRLEETAKYKSQLDSWMAQINAETTDADKLKKAHDLICQKVVYNNAFLEDNDEEKWKSQTSYSVLCGDTTVCAGYSMAMELLCNGIGIDCICVTSSSHQWNKIRINDSWYNMDCTWDDNDTVSLPILYSYYLRSDNTYDTISTYSKNSHTELAMWDGIIPDCSLDSGASYYSTGTLPEIINKVKKPVITVDSTSGKNMVTISSDTPGTKIYYNVNGEAPSCAGSKSIEYTEPFEVNATDIISAIATKDTYYDSDVKDYSMSWAVSNGHTLSLEGNIAIKFYMILPAEVAEDGDNYMLFELPNDTYQKIAVKDAKKSIYNSQVEYCFSCYMKSNQTKDVVTAQLYSYNGAKVLSEKMTYSINEYIDVIGKNTSSQAQKLQPLTNALGVYGDYSTAYFSKTPLAETSEISSVTVDMLKPYEQKKEGTIPTGLIDTGVTLDLSSALSIKYYFALEDGHGINEYTFKVDGVEYIPTKLGNEYVICVDNVVSYDIDRTYILTVNDQYTKKYSALSYAYSIMSKSGNDSLKSLMKAMYLYYVEAEKYFNN